MFRKLGRRGEGRMPCVHAATLACVGMLACAWVVTGCAGSSEPAPEPAAKTAEDLFNEANQTLTGTNVLFLIDSVDYARAIAQFQEIIDNYPFSEFATLSELKIADSYFDQRDYAQASSFYQEFVELHPTHPKVPYALLRNGECAYGQMLAPDQDQGKTRDAIQQFDAVIERFPDSEEAARARTLKAEAKERLAVHEVVIGDFYFESEKYHAAVPRYRDALAQSAEHEGYRKTRARLGISLRRSGEREAGTRVLEDVLPDPDLDAEVREEAEAELGYEVALREPASSPEGADGEGGWSLWPFGGSDDEEEAAVVEAPVPRADEPEETSSGWGFWPFGGSSEPEPQVASDSAEVSAADEASEKESAEEDDSGSWFWPF